MLGPGDIGEEGVLVCPLVCIEEGRLTKSSVFRIDPMSPRLGERISSGDATGDGEVIVLEVLPRVLEALTVRSGAVVDIGARRGLSLPLAEERSVIPDDWLLL